MTLDNKTDVLDNLTETYNQTSLTTRNGTICTYEREEKLFCKNDDNSMVIGDISPDNTQCVGEECHGKDEL